MGKGIKDFKALKKVKIKKKKKDKMALADKVRAATEDLPEKGSEEEMFFNAMRGVDPIKESMGGRDVSPAAKQVKGKVSTDPGKEDAAALLQFLSGETEFALEFTEEYMYGFARNLDSKVFTQLKAGQLSWEAHLDLHGLNSRQAGDALLHFMKEAYLGGHRCLLLVTGRGKNSPGGQSVLKQEILTWLTQEPLRRIVLAFCTAKPKDGGAGALYILLRKQKKKKGKVKWVRMKNWEDD